MSKTLLVFGTDKEFRTLDHLLYHHPDSSLNLHHTVEFKGQMFGCPDIQRHTSHITFMDRSYDFSHHRVSYLLGKDCQFLLIVTNHFRNHRNTGTLQKLMHNFG